MIVKQLLCKTTPLLFLLLTALLSPELVFATPDSGIATSLVKKGKKEFVKKIEKSFSLGQDGRLELTNRYGRINVQSWEENRTDIKIRIIVKADDQNRANEVFDRIRIDFTETGNLVGVATQIGTSNKGWWDRLWSGDWNSSDDFKIVYDVKMPSRAFLKTDAMYCNVNCGDHNGEVDVYAKYGNVDLATLGQFANVEVKYGNVNVEALNERARFRVGYGNLDIDRASGELEVNMRYGQLRIETADRLDLDTRYTNTRIVKVQRMRFDGSYGDIEIDEVHTLRASTDYLGYEIGKVTGMIDVNTDYGDLEIDLLAAGFTEARFKGSYADVEIKVDQAAGYEVSARTSYADVDLPNSVDVNRRESRSNSVSVSGKKAGQGQGYLDLASSYGDITLRE